jgi:tetratricopeptide (TPR) repeat protein
MEDQNSSWAAKMLYVRGKAHSCVQASAKLAEELLSSAIKIDPSLAEAWTALAMIAWLKKDAEGARQYYSESIEARPTKEALRELSVVVRQPSKESENIITAESVEQSIFLAKQAVQLDLQDHSSWYFLG